MSTLLTALLAELTPHIERMIDARIAALTTTKPETQRPGWATPPRAAQLCNVSVKRVRALIDAGRVQVRSRSLNPAAKQAKLEVHLGSLEAALAGEAPKVATVTDAASWAAARAARKGAP